MSRLPLIEPLPTAGQAKPFFGAIERDLAQETNLVRTLANSPAALDGYVKLRSGLTGGALTAQERELIALIVAEINWSAYCLSTHRVLSLQLGMNEDRIKAARRDSGSNPRSEALLNFTQAVVLQRGEISDQSFKEICKAGFKPGEIVEIIGNIALNIFANYVTQVAKTELDLPLVEPDLKAQPEGAI
jgi:uncharacterized peroxidase-related enzyme